MSGFGLWRRRWLGKGRSAVLGISLLLIAASLACSSEPDTAPSDAAPPQSDSVAQTVAPSPSPPSPQNASAASTSLPPTTALGSLLSLPELIEAARPSIALIDVESVSRGLFFDFTDEGAGSGIVVSSDGYVVTNFHVIQNADAVKVNLPSGETYDARVVGRDRITDLAMLKIDAEGLPTASFGNSDALEVGDWVVAMGNALALKGGPTVTLGIVSARGRTITTERGPLYDMIQTDAAINDGNSGGPLLNLDGEIVGISTAILREAQGIGFAVSSSIAQPIIRSLIEHGRVVRPLIGLTGADVTPARANQLNLSVTEGVIITRAARDGPAYAAGLRVGDVITKINGIPTPDMGRFLTLLWSYSIGDEVQVEYIVDNRTMVATVSLSARPPE